MYDILIRGGDVVDGTGSARRRADVGIHGGRIVAIGELGEVRSGRDDRRHRQGRRARLRRRAHALRRAGVLGPARSRRRRCTASPPCSPATAASPSRRCPTTRRRRLPHADAGARRGHAARVAARRACRGTGQLDRRVPRRASRARSASTPASWSATRRIRRVVMGDGRRPARGHARRARRDGARCSTRASRPAALGFSSSWARDAQRRRGPHGAVALRDARRDHRAVPRGRGEHQGTSLEFIPMVGPGSSRGPSS